MPRTARIESPTGYYHVMMRGNNREKIFAKEEQKHSLLELLSLVGNVKIVAYCLMDNHLHLVLKAGLTELSEAIKKLNIRYAMRFNKGTGRVGHVFQDRYKSEAVLDEPQLLQLVRYVHNNPVKAGMVIEAIEYPWSSYLEYAEKNQGQKGRPFLLDEGEKDFVKSFFAGDKEFRSFHQIPDKVDFLEIDEDLEHYRNQIALRIIEEFCTAHGIKEVKELKLTQGQLEILIVRLLLETKLSHRKVAKHLSIGNNLVHSVGCALPQEKRY